MAVTNVRNDTTKQSNAGETWQTGMLRRERTCEGFGVGEIDVLAEQIGNSSIGRCVVASIVALVRFVATVNCRRELKWAA